jgi:hypothetical protein
MPLTRERQQEIIEKLASPRLKIKLSRTPTTMGPGYIAEKIAEILEAKSEVNDYAEEVEHALCEATVRENDIREEVRLRTDLEYLNIDFSTLPDIKDAKGRQAYIWNQVEKSYVTDRAAVLKEGEPPPQPFQLSEDFRVVTNEVTELKSLLKIIEFRRDELSKLDSGIRLQQKTMETEASIYGKRGIPRPDLVVDREPDPSDDVDSSGDDIDDGLDPPPITEDPMAGR